MTEATAGWPQRSGKIHALTSLRFFAALFVVCYHTIWTFLPEIQRGGLLGRFLNLGNTSVSFFFLLSGYILGVVYLRRGRPVALGDFYRARFARVYPLFLLTLLLDTPSVFLRSIPRLGLAGAESNTAIAFGGAAVMLQGWRMQFCYIDYPNWSLSVETLFYLIFPFLGVALWKLRGRMIWMVGVAIYLGGLGLALLASQHMWRDKAERLPILHVSTFALGVLLARWQTVRRETGGFGLSEDETRVERVRRSRLAAALSLAGLGVFGAVVYWSPALSQVSICDGLLAPLFVCWIWAFSDAEWAPAKVLSARWLVVLGEASFGLYLFHIPVFHALEWLGWTHGAVWFPVYLALSTGVSVLSFYYFEAPARRWILSWKRGHVKESIEVAAAAQ
jgi:peptidoglycan/LPS O-acetylase OafA/YrhL